MTKTDFSWSDYCYKLFENNPGLNPEQLWEIVLSDLNDVEKVLAFNQRGGKGDMASRRHSWANSKTSHYTPEHMTNVATQSAQPTKVGVKGSVGSVKHDYFGELAIKRCTHNTARADQWVPFGEWRADDWRSVATYHYDRGATYNASGSWANKAAIILEDIGPEATTGDNWTPIQSKLGACPIITNNLD